MDDLYWIHSSISCSDDVTGGVGNSPTTVQAFDGAVQFETAEMEVGGLEMSDLIKDQIANHPLCPNLVSAYIQCRKVGAPLEMASLLEEISKQNRHSTSSRCEIGADPELDEFMESYCEVLHRYKEELSKPFDEATTFLSNIESELSSLLNETLTTSFKPGNCPKLVYSRGGRGPVAVTEPPICHPSARLVDWRKSIRIRPLIQRMWIERIDDEASGTSEEDLSCGEPAESRESSGPQSREQELKVMLLRKYSGYLSSLRKDFFKKRTKGKLSKDARIALLDWWNTHYRWPYPTEEEKMKLSDVTGLDQKQINNWFVNQRKRHWRPSEDMRFALMEGVSGGIGEPVYFDSAGEAGSVDN
ncbi:unnamed protein product [Camellia sinensis]